MCLCLFVFLFIGCNIDRKFIVYLIYFQAFLFYFIIRDGWAAQEVNGRPAKKQKTETINAPANQSLSDIVSMLQGIIHKVNQLNDVAGHHAMDIKEGINGVISTIMQVKVNIIIFIYCFIYCMAGDEWNN